MILRFCSIISTLFLAGCLTQSVDVAATSGYNRSAGDLHEDPRSFLATVQRDAPMDGRSLAERQQTLESDESGTVWNVSTRGELDAKHLDKFRSDEVRYSLISYLVETKRHKPFVGKERSWEEATLKEAVATARADFLRSLGDTPVGTEVLLYVHGFNNTPEVAVKRIAELTHHLGFHGIPIAFTWPSHGGTGRLAELKGATWYLYDLQSANFSRDALAQLLGELSGMPNINRVHVVAHSMGSWLTMESLRQIAIAGQTDILNKIASVILLAPDVDTQVFEKQVVVTDLNSGRASTSVGDLLVAFQLSSPATRKFAQKISVFAGKDDKAIGGSGWLYGAPRIGTSEVSQRLADAGVQFIDTKEYKAEDLFSHYKATDHRAIEQMRDILGIVPVQSRTALLGN